MKEKQTHEGWNKCSAYLALSCTVNLKVPLDGERLIRMDDWELDPELSPCDRSCSIRWMKTASKLWAITEGFKDEFLQLNGLHNHR
ncbi:hypothetical protein OH492_27870 [Vibrio chagasii]|nr:hypothetical protein [Vibrio chagasii]